MRIVTSALEYPPNSGGVGVNTQNSVEALQRLGHQVRVLKADQWLSVYKLAAFRMMKWELLMRELNLGEFDLLWLHDPLIIFNQVWRQITSSGSAVVISLHTPLFHLGRLNHPYGGLGVVYYRLFQLPESSMIRSLLATGAKFTAVSPYLAEAFLRRFGQKIAFILPPPPTVAEIPDREQCRKELERKLGIPNDAILLISVGRFWDKRKNFPVVLSFFHAIEKKVPNAYLILQGTSTWQVSGHILQLPFTRDRTSISRIYGAADAYLSLSTTESMPMAVLDAVGSNLRLILSDIEAHRWIVESNGGLLVPLGDPASTIKAVVKYLLSQAPAKSPRSPMREWESYVSKHLAIAKD